MPWAFCNLRRFPWFCRSLSGKKVSSACGQLRVGIYSGSCWWMKISTMWHWVASLWGNSRCNVSWSMTSWHLDSCYQLPINWINRSWFSKMFHDFPVAWDWAWRWADWHGDVSHPRIGSLGLHQFITIQVETRGTIDNRDVYKLENAGKVGMNYWLLFEIYASTLVLVYLHVFHYIISIMFIFGINFEARSINLLGFQGDGMAVFRAIAAWRALGFWPVNDCRRCCHQICFSIEWTQEISRRHCSIVRNWQACMKVTKASECCSEEQENQLRLK